MVLAPTSQHRFSPLSFPLIKNSPRLFPRYFVEATAATSSTRIATLQVPLAVLFFSGQTNNLDQVQVTPTSGLPARRLGLEEPQVVLVPSKPSPSHEGNQRVDGLKSHGHLDDTELSEGPTLDGPFSQVSSTVFFSMRLLPCPSCGRK